VCLEGALKPLGVDSLCLEKLDTLVFAFLFSATRFRSLSGLVIDTGNGSALISSGLGVGSSSSCSRDAEVTEFGDRMLIDVCDYSLSKTIFCYFYNLFGLECFSMTCLFFKDFDVITLWAFYRFSTPDLLPIGYIVLCCELDITIFFSDLFMLFRYDPKLENMPVFIPAILGAFGVYPY
jgi:hypothetical protein